MQDAMVEVTVLRLQMLHEHSQLEGHVTKAFVLFSHSQNYLLQLQVIVHPLELEFDHGEMLVKRSLSDSTSSSFPDMASVWTI